MADPSLHDYAPLELTFRADAKATVPPRQIGNVLCLNRAPGNYFVVSLLLTPHGSVFCGDEGSPDQPVRFVNTTVDALAKFIKVHADYTNDRIYRCQLSGREDFKTLFLRGIGALVAQFHVIDADAVASRDNWWPYILDAKLAEYGGHTTPPAR